MGGQLAQGQNPGGLGVSDFDRELLFDLEDKLDGGHGIERVHPQILDEAVVRMQAGEVERQVRREDLAQAAGDVGVIRGEIGLTESNGFKRWVLGEVGEGMEPLALGAPLAM